MLMRERHIGRGVEPTVEAHWPTVDHIGVVDT